MNTDTDFFREEVRLGYTVTAEQKKIWNVQLTMAQHLDRICQKYAIPYYMNFGTLLGAVRHRGFVPWDIDMDFCMLRKDYMRFLTVAPAELPAEYTFQTDFLHYEIIKIRDDRTSAVYFPLMEPDVSQGIYIDISPIDDVCDDKDFPDISGMQHEILLIMHNPELMLQYAKERGSTVLPMDFIIELLHTDPAEVQKQFREFCLSYAGKSTMVADIYNYVRFGERFPSEWLGTPVMLSFEGFRFPAPSHSHDLLHLYYGDDYMTPIPRESDLETMIFDAERPYTAYLKGGLLYDPAYWIALDRITPEEA